MNEEEKKSIEDIEEMIELYEDDCLLTTGEDIMYLKVILSLINKLQKQKEKLKKELREERAMNIEALNTLKECVHKDRIKEKIEEYNKKCDECNFQNSEICKDLKKNYNCSIQSVLELLEELLGE